MYMKKWFIFIILILGIGLVVAVQQAYRADQKWKDAMVNVKAYDTQLKESKKQTIAFQLTIEQLKAYNDSIFQELEAVSKELKIKEKNIKALQYAASTFTRTDTVVFTDTLFKEPSLNVDTMLGDQWYNVRVGLKYPSTISVAPEFKSKKYIVVASKKETVNPPKKFFLFRWFQKKHYVLTIDVVEKNPYVTEENNRYIEIIK